LAQLAKQVIPERNQSTLPYRGQRLLGRAQRKKGAKKQGSFMGQPEWEM
jgi:hypothetical protein